MQLTVRAAVAEDAPVVADLVHRAYRGESSRAGWTTEADLLEGQRIDLSTVATMIAADSTEVLVGVDETGHVVACCELQQQASGAGYFGMFAVEPTLQSAGLGRQMLGAAEDLAVSRSMPRIEMTVIAQRTELLDWYVRRGYLPTGETKPFPYGNEAFGLPQRDDLHFVVLAKPMPANPS